MSKTTHGMTGTALHKCWKNMKQRCYNPKNDRYPHYGAKGITVCDDWLDSVIFISWALSNGYEDGLTIDRKDSSKGYSPSNCRWVPKSENHDEMMRRNYSNKSGVFSEGSFDGRKTNLRKTRGKLTKLLWKGVTYEFGSRGELVDYLVEQTGRKRSSIKSQVVACLNPKSKCNSIAGGVVYE